MTKEEARKIIMSVSQRALSLFRSENPLPKKPSEDYFNRQIAFINAYLNGNVSEETMLAAI